MVLLANYVEMMLSYFLKVYEATWIQELEADLDFMRSVAALINIIIQVGGLLLSGTHLHRCCLEAGPACGHPERGREQQRDGGRGPGPRRGGRHRQHQQQDQDRGRRGLGDAALLRSPAW